MRSAHRPNSPHVFARTHSTVGAVRCTAVSSVRMLSVALRAVGSGSVTISGELSLSVKRKLRLMRRECVESYTLHPSGVRYSEGMLSYRRSTPPGSIRSLQTGVTFGVPDPMSIRHRLSPATGSQTPRRGVRSLTQTYKLYPHPSGVARDLSLQKLRPRPF